MGHKVNPDIFRLGVTKTWSYQLRSNKNFLKNLFIFRMLKNLFINYSIPLFTWKKHRNLKINDKLVLKGEEQVIKSPFVSKNVLFSHVFFGLLNDSIIIESFFIEAQLKQNKKKLPTPQNELLQRAKEYLPWQSGFYKKKLFNSIKKDYRDLKSKEKLKLLFANRKFRKLSRKTKIYSVKSARTLSKDFYFFSKNYNAKYSKNLDKFFKLKLYVVNPRAKTLKFRSIKRRKFNSYKMSFSQFYIKLQKKKRRQKSLFFNVIKKRKVVARFKKLKPLKYLRKRKYYRLKVIPNYKLRSKRRIVYSKYIAKIKYLSSKRAGSVSKAYLKKKGIPKTPLRLFNHIMFQRNNFYKIYKNLSLLKYFFRVLKYLRYFGIKKRIFFSHNLISLLLNFMGIVKKTILSKKMFVIMQTLIYYSYSLSFWNFINMKKKYLNRFVMYKAVSKTLFRSVLELTKCNKVVFSVTSQNKYKFGSSLVLNYILIKLGQYFNINEIVNPLSFFIKHLTCIAGYKIMIRGRLTRKERAAVMIRSGKKMPLSSISANVDYSQGSKIMKFGMVGIKVYLLLKPSSIINLYTFSFKYAKVS